MSNYTIKSKDVNEILENIDELQELLTDRISDLHEVKGWAQARHAYIFYRQLLREIRDQLRAAIKEEKT